MINSKKELNSKRFFIRKWYMQVKKSKERDNAFENAMKVIDKNI